MDVRRYTTRNNFAVSPSINTQFVSLSLRPVETRATRNELTNLAALIGELDAIFSSTYARRIEPFYSTITHSSRSIYLPKTPRPLPARSTGRSALVGVQFGRPSLTVAPVTRTPVPAPKNTVVPRWSELNSEGLPSSLYTDR